MRELINRYKTIIRNNCVQDPGTLSRSVGYWKDILFARTLELVIPFSFIILIPTLWYCLYSELYTLAFFHFSSFCLVLFIGFGSYFNVNIRKFLLIFSTYLAAIFLLIYTGVEGPGLLYLYAACVFGILILPKKYAYLWSLLNLFLVLMIALLFQYNLSPTAKVNETDVGEWFAIAGNMVFLCLFSSALLPRLFDGLSETFKSYEKVKNELTIKTLEQEKLLIEIGQINEDLEQFAYIASHDLQEPLRMISGFMDLLKKKYENELDEKAHQYIYFATDGAKRMKTIIQDLLEYSRASNIIGDKEPIDLNLLINEYLTLRSKLISEKNAKIKFDNLPTVYSFKAPLLQILNNLLDNALKYTKNGIPPEVHIRYKELPNDWQISIKDNGLGIDEDQHDKIFIIFHRLNEETLHSSGTGIGLSIVKKIVEKMGGEIWLDSKPNIGSTFHFTIPKS